MTLQGKRVAVLAENMYQELELWYPLLRLREAGAETLVVGTGSAATYTSKHGYPVDVDAVAGELRAADVDAVVVPGGYAPDLMRRYPAMVGSGWPSIAVSASKRTTAPEPGAPTPLTVT